jgi:AP-4 complex subunit mu-1
MITSFFVLSPRGDTILSKMYRTRPEVGAHERSHTEAFFRKIKFWDEMNNKDSTLRSQPEDLEQSVDGSTGGTKKDPPPVFTMPDGQSYFHVNRNGLIFACSTDKNVSPCEVIEVSLVFPFLVFISKKYI